VARRLTTFSSLVQIASSFLNTLQDDVAALLKGNGGNNDFLSAGMLGMDILTWQAKASMASGTLLLVDTNDWHDREIFVVCRLNSTATQRIGQANDFSFDSACTFTGTGENSFGHGYLGKGGQKSGGGAVSNGNPPVPAAGSSWAVSVNGTGLAATGNFVALYTDTQGGSYQLYCYNNLATTIQPTMVVFAIAPTGLRP
jgi:hypothetical protein